MSIQNSDKLKMYRLVALNFEYYINLLIQETFFVRMDTSLLKRINVGAEHCTVTFKKKNTIRVINILRL